LCQENLENLNCFVDGGGVPTLITLLQDNDARVALFVHWYARVRVSGALLLAYSMPYTGLTAILQIHDANGIPQLVPLLNSGYSERLVNAVAEIADAHSENQFSFQQNGALPLLIRLLDSDDIGLRQKSLVALATICNSNEVNMRVAGGLGLIGRLTVMLRDPETSNLAAMALATCADHITANQTAATRAIPILVDMIGGSPSEPLRYGLLTSHHVSCS